MTSTQLPATPQAPESVQPGGGWCMRLELLWGRCRRACLRNLRPAYVALMNEVRQGTCPNCPHDVIDDRDLKYWRNVCGYWFRPQDDRFAYRDRLGFARYGLAELFIFSVLLVGLLAIFTFLAIEVHWLFWLIVAAGGLTWLEIVYFFRDPERMISTDPRALVSPADGVVTNVEEIDEPEMGQVLRVSIFLSIFNVHVNRVPWPGRVTAVRYFPGEYLDARNAQSAVRNEQLWIDLDAQGMPMRVKQISGAIARRIVCWLKAGDLVEKGKRLGMIKFGSRTDLLIPAGRQREVLVKVGDKVRGGSTVLLFFGAVE